MTHQTDMVAIVCSGRNCNALGPKESKAYRDQWAYFCPDCQAYRDGTKERPKDEKPVERKRRW